MCHWQQQQQQQVAGHLQVDTIDVALRQMSSITTPAAFMTFVT